MRVCVPSVWVKNGNKRFVTFCANKLYRRIDLHDQMSLTTKHKYRMDWKQFKRKLRGTLIQEHHIYLVFHLK